MTSLRQCGIISDICYNDKNCRYDFSYKFIRDHGGWSNWTYEVFKTAVIITLLEHYK